MTKLHLSPKTVTITFVSFAVSGLTSNRQMPVPLLLMSFTPNLITVIHSTINSLSLNCPVSSRSRTRFLARTIVKAPKSCYITPILRSLHWLRIDERIEYKLLSLTYKVLTTIQPTYLRNLISVQRPHSTRSSSVVTLARPPTSSSLKLMIAPFITLHLVSGISSLYLFVNLILVPVPPLPTHLFFHPSLIPILIHHCTSITPSLFHPWLKTYLFHKSYLHVVSLLPLMLPLRTISQTFLLSYSVFFGFYYFFRFCAVRLIKLPS